jgi:hypothetical protein
MTIILKIGRVYKDRRGQKWKVTHDTGNGIFPYSAINLDYGAYSNTFTASGRFTAMDGESDNDLVTELSEGDMMLDFFKEKQNGYWKEWWDGYDFG